MEIELPKLLEIINEANDLKNKSARFNQDIANRVTQLQHDIRDKLNSVDVGLDKQVEKLMELLKKGQEFHDQEKDSKEGGT